MSAPKFCLYLVGWVAFCLLLGWFASGFTRGWIEDSYADDIRAIYRESLERQNDRWQRAFDRATADYADSVARVREQCEDR